MQDSNDNDPLLDPTPKGNEPRPDDKQNVQISAVVRIHCPDTQQTILETRG